MAELIDPKTVFPVLADIPWSTPSEDEHYYHNLIGTKTRRHYMPEDWMRGMNDLGESEDTLEWVDVLEAIQLSEGTFTFVYLGPGFGRWLANGHHAAKKLGHEVFLVAVEAEDTHFNWMQEHLSDNGIDPAACRLIHAPVAAASEEVFFTQGHADHWYGQSVIPAQDSAFGDWPEAEVVKRTSITLAEACKDLDVIDLISMDIQGQEAEVLCNSMDFLDAHVKRIHIGTHGRELEVELRDGFGKHGWQCLRDYPCQTKAYETPLGPIDFQDGIQTWINPRFPIVR